MGRDDGPFAGTGLDRVTIAVLALIAGINALSTSAYLPALPEVASSLDASPSRVQLTLTAYLIGVGIGQITWGPLSDIAGRRRPLMVGLAGYTVACLLCALAPSIEALMVLRAVQGWTASAGAVLVRVVMVDRAEGTALAKMLTVLMVIALISPVVAPLVGSGMLLLGGWRLVFVFLAVMGLPMLLGAWRRVPETLPEGRRREGGFTALGQAVRSLLRDPRFVGFALANSSSFLVMFAFMSGAPFLLQTGLGMTPVEYALVTAGIVGLMGATLVAVSRALGRTFAGGRTLTPAVMARAGLRALLGGTVTFTLCVLLETPGWTWIMLMAWCVGCLALIVGSASSLALGRARHAAGTGTALMGVMQSLLGALGAPLVGLGGGTAALPMALVMTGAAIVATTAFELARRPLAGV